MNFGQYELLELIAMGGMAEVYRGKVAGAEGFEKFVAIKRILPDLSEDDRFVKMLLTEARIHAQLSHRNIVQIHDLGISEDGEYFIVLEYVEGYDLRVIMEQLSAQGEIIPEALSLHIAAEVAQGLHFAHEQRGSDGRPLGLVHRDVTPSNVLISMAGEVKLSDFGLAKRRHDLSVVGSLKGNLAYMSPEQARQSSLDRRTDVFSLGAVLFEMLTGRRLREITDEVKGWDEVASGRVPLLRSVRPDLPESFERPLMQALATEPGRRYPTAAAFAAALRALLGQMNTPVGASDLQSLLSVLSPPRKPRSPMERSKIIRLGPEVLAVDTSKPDLNPSKPRSPTPRPPPSPAVRAPIAFGRGVPGLDATTSPPRRQRKTPIQWQATPPTPRTPVQGASPPAGTTVPSHSEVQDQATPPPRVPTPRVNPPPQAGPAAAGAPSRAAGPYRPTLKVDVVSAGLWRPVAVSVAALLVLAASAVHLTLIPLDVLVVWQRPAVLSVASDPAGAGVKLDGVRLAEPTPTKPTIKRDRFDHLLEISLDGYRPARAIVRYDRTVALWALIPLHKDVGPAIETVRAQPLTPSADAGAARAVAAPDASAMDGGSGSTGDASASESTQNRAD